MKLNMKMEAAIVTAIGGRLVQSDHIRKRHLPKIVELNQDRLQDSGKVADFRVRQRAHIWMRSFRSHEDFVRIPGKVRKERDRCVVLGNYATPFFALSGQNILKENAAGLC